MATTTNTLLLILIVRCAIVLSKYESDEREDEISAGDAELLLNKMEEHDDAIKLLQEHVKGLQAELDRHFPPCKLCKCT